MVEGDQRLVALEDVGAHRVAGSPAAPVDAEQRRGRGLRALGLDLLERRVGSADVVEDAVEEHPQPTLAAAATSRSRSGGVAEAGVDATMVDRVVPVRAGGEDRAQQQAR